LLFSEDEEEEERSEPTEKTAEANEQEQSVVKEELEEAAPKSSKKARTESIELEVFSDEALASFDLSELKGDVATLEGLYSACRLWVGMS
jgi:hypothetical protein